MHILIGALIGGALFAISYAITTKVKGGSLSWKGAVAAFAGGAVSGGLAAATFGESLIAQGGASALGFVAADGAAGSATEQIVNNELDGDPITKDVAKQAAWGAATAPVFYGAFKGLARFLPEAGAIAGKPVVADGAKLGTEVAADAGKSVPKVIRGEGGRFVKNPDWKPEAPKVDGAEAPAKPTMIDHMKNPSHHAKAAAGLASTGVVATALDKIKGALGEDPKNAKDAKDAKGSKNTTTSSSNAGNVTVSVPAGSGSVSVTVNVGGNSLTPTTRTINHPVMNPIPVIAIPHPTGPAAPAVNGNNTHPVLVPLPGHTFAIPVINRPTPTVGINGALTAINAAHP